MVSATTLGRPPLSLHASCTLTPNTGIVPSRAGGSPETLFLINTEMRVQRTGLRAR